MFNLILLAYRDTAKHIFKRPQLFLLLVLVALVNIPLYSAMAKSEQNSLNNNLLFLLFQLVSWTVNVLLFWFAFHSEGVTPFSLSSWFGKYYLRVLFQYVGGFFLFLPFYAGLRIIFGEEGLALQPGHSILMFSISVWMFFAYMGTLWLCYRNEGFLRNVSNAIKDVFRHFGVYLILRLLALAVANLSFFIQNSFAIFTGLACGLLVVTSVLEFITWIAIMFGFLKLRKQAEQTLIL